MHLSTFKIKFFHIYPYIFLHFEPPYFFFCTNCQKPNHTFTHFNFSLNYPLYLENPSSSTSTTLIHSGGSTTAKLHRTTTQPIPSSLSRPIHYHLQSRFRSLSISKISCNKLPLSVSTLFRRPPPSYNYKGTLKSHQRHWIYQQGNQLKIFGLGFWNLEFFEITSIAINWLIEYAIEGPNDMSVLWNLIGGLF